MAKAALILFGLIVAAAVCAFAEERLSKRAAMTVAFIGGAVTCLIGTIVGHP